MTASAVPAHVVLDLIQLLCAKVAKAQDQGALVDDARPVGRQRRPWELGREREVAGKCAAEAAVVAETDRKRSESGPDDSTAPEGRFDLTPPRRQAA